MKGWTEGKEGRHCFTFDFPYFSVQIIEFRQCCLDLVFENSIITTKTTTTATTAAATTTTATTSLINT